MLRRVKLPKLVRHRFKKVEFEVPKNRFDGNQINIEAPKPNLTRKKRLRANLKDLESPEGGSKHPLLQRALEDTLLSPVSPIDAERSRQMAYNHSDYGYLVINSRGRSENFDYNGNYHGNQHEQANLYWREAESIEEELTMEDMVNNISKMLVNMENENWAIDQRRHLISVCMSQLCESIGTRFIVEDIHLPEEFLNRLRLSLSSVGVRFRNTELDDSRKCLLSGVTLDHDFSMAERRLTDYLIKIYEIISLSQSSQIDLLSDRDVVNVKELNQAMNNFLEFAETAEIDVIIDLQNFCHRVLKSPRDRPYHCEQSSESIENFIMDLFGTESISKEDQRVFHESLKEAFKVILTHAREKFKTKNGHLHCLILTPQGQNIPDLIQTLSSADVDLDITCFKTPKLKKLDRKRIRRKEDISKENEVGEVILHFDDFFALLSATIFENSILISTDKFQNIFPYHLKRGFMDPYSIFMSTAKARKEDALRISKARDEWRDMLSSSLRKKVIFSLIDRYKGIRLDYFKKELDVRPQCHEDMFFLPYQTFKNDIPVTNWYLFSME